MASLPRSTPGFRRKRRRKGSWRGTACTSGHKRSRCVGEAVSCRQLDRAARACVKMEAIARRGVAGRRDSGDRERSGPNLPLLNLDRRRSRPRLVSPRAPVATGAGKQRPLAIALLSSGDVATIALECGGSTFVISRGGES
jgi:hypothetical protein